MMTVHAAKGLEFPNVFIVGMEEELFPSSMSKDNIKAIEEERRLFYVAITRAETNCCISYARSRFKNGQTNVCYPSRFLRDLDMQYVELPSASYNLPRKDSFDEARCSYQSYAIAPPIQSNPMSQRGGESVQTPTVHRKLTKISSVSSRTGSNSSCSGLEVGQRVSHDRFGEGVILAIEGEEQNKKALVDFDNFGKKQLLLKFARLKVVG